MTEKRAEKQRLFERFTRELDCLTAGEELPSILVALSGGADSVLLLTFLSELSKKRGFSLEAYHLDHQIRGAESREDAAFCEALCQRLGMTLHLEEEDLPTLAAKEKKSLEECARDRRYSGLAHVRAKRRLAFIATGHNADDQLETMLFRLARGSSLKGLCGIPERRGAILRPLLSFSSEEIRQYCQENGICYRVDSTNLSDLYVRNRIRHGVMPLLDELYPGASVRAAFSAGCLRQDEQLLSAMVPEGALCHRELLELHPSILRRYIERQYKAFAPHGQLVGRHLLELCELVRAGAYGKGLSLPALVRATLYREGLVFSRDKEEKQGYSLQVAERNKELSFPGGTFYLMERCFFDEFSLKNRKIHKLFIKETCNSATIEGTLTLRSVKKGDRIRIGGMTKKVFSLLGEMGVPLKDRDLYPILCDDRGPLWLPGKAPRDDARAPDGDLLLAVFFEAEG